MKTSKETVHDVDFTYVEPGIAGMEIPMNPALDYDEKLELAYEAIREAYPTFEDVTITSIKDTDIEQ